MDHHHHHHRRQEEEEILGYRFLLNYLLKDKSKRKEPEFRKH